MRKILIPAILMATLPMACSGQGAGEEASDTETSAASDDMMPGTKMPMSDFTEVTDEMTGPIFINPDGPVGVAVSGYDAVSYFEGDGTPIKGSEEFGITYNEVDYYFSSAENAKKFEAEPGKYAPQFGGHCAWAMSRGRLAPGDPVYYRVVDGKLYLNFNKQVQETWLKDIPGFIEKANAAWPSVPEDATFDNQ